MVHTDDVEISKCYDKVKSLLFKKGYNGFNYIPINRFLNELGFSHTERRKIYSLILTNESCDTILPFEWLNLYYKDFRLGYVPKGYYIFIDNYESIYVDMVEKKTYISDTILVSSMIEYYGLNPNDLVYYLKQWMEIYYVIPHLRSAVNFELKIRGIEYYENRHNFYITPFNI